MPYHRPEPTMSFGKALERWEQQMKEKPMGTGFFVSRASQPQYTHAKFNDGTELCKAHFDSKYPNAWNTLIVNAVPWGELFQVKLVSHDDDSTIHCKQCRESMKLINNDDNDEWTQAWASVAMLIGESIAIWTIRQGGLSSMKDTGYSANKPFPTFTIYTSRENFEKELRHQSYRLLTGIAKIKITEDVKVKVRYLIMRAYESLRGE